MHNPYIQNLNAEIEETISSIAFASRYADQRTVDKLYSKLNQLQSERDCQSEALEALEMLQS